MVGLLFMGIQGSGKGTQAALMRENFGLSHINMGESFRKHIREGTPIGTEAKKFVEKGKLCPDRLAFEIIEEEMAHNPSGFVLDGFPRTMPQARHVLEYYHPDHVILFELSRKDALQRILSRVLCTSCHRDYNLQTKKPLVEGVCDVCGGELKPRTDDTAEAIELRFREFNEQTGPLIDLFGEKGLLLRVSADEDPLAIHAKIVRMLRLTKPAGGGL